jgi:catechol 2,3-dioxygenase-like lactoylglutathione lyase family enzyme
MIQARRIGHAVFETKDLDRLSEHYTEVVGLVVAARDRDRVFLASPLGHLAVELRKGDEVGCRKLSFEVVPGTDLGDAARELSSHGIHSDRSNDPAPGLSNVLTFADPKGTQIEIFSGWSPLGDAQPPQGISVTKLGHVGYFTKDLQKSIDFYAKVLGFRISDWIGDHFVFMRCNSDHHTVNFLRGEETRMHHIAFELADWNQMKTACDILARKGINMVWGPVRNGPGHNTAIYYREPDDQLVELFCELDRMVDEELGYFEPRPWHRDKPQRPKVWESGSAAYIWGLPPTPDFLRGRPDFLPGRNS